MTRWLLEFSLHETLGNKSSAAWNLLIAVFLAAATWWLCGFIMWLWNRRFKMRWTDHACCALASLVTVAATFAFQSVGGFKQAAIQAISAWEQIYEQSQSYHQETFVQIYDRLRQLYREKGWAWDEENYPDPRHPTNPGRVLPARNGDMESQSLVLEGYRDRALDHLRITEPVLSKILWQDAQIPLEPLNRDMDDFFRENPNGHYRFATGTVRITRELAVEVLNNQVSKQIPMLRLKLAGLLGLAQALAFSLAAVSAYSDLKTRTR